jgi:hypothetical protein
MIMFADVEYQDAQYLAFDAVARARQTMPRVTGAHARRVRPIYDRGHFGVYWPDKADWFMEHGSKPRTMKNLQGKTIPMWVADPDGSIRQKNPKTKVRTTEDGRLQVLIFRRAAKIGQRKTVRKRNKVTGAMETSTTPASYPGAPGRIARRTPGGFGPSGGQIARGNVGVRWYNPGIRAMGFFNSALAETAFEAGLEIGTVYACDGASMEALVEQRKRESA